MRCEDFQAAVLSGVESEEMLSHLRTCQACLNVAVEHEPDLMFRAIGGEIEPPGGAEMFAADVMHQIHVRDTERRVAPRERGSNALHRWALAAAATLMVVSGALFWPRGETISTPVSHTAVHQQASVAEPVVFRPVVESWDSSSAMIIEIPEEETSDLKVVMVFDESLPADL